MENSIKPIVGTGHFQWNTGGWWGSSLGSTAWMLPTAAILVANSQVLISLLPIACFAVMNIIAAALWVRRDRVAPFRAYMILLGALAIVTPLVWTGVANFGSAQSLAHMNWPESPVPGIGAFLIAPTLALLFVILEYRSHGRRDIGPDQTHQAT